MNQIFKVSRIIVFVFFYQITLNAQSPFLTPILLGDTIESKAIGHQFSQDWVAKTVQINGKYTGGIISSEGLIITTKALLDAYPIQFPYLKEEDNKAHPLPPMKISHYLKGKEVTAALLWNIESYFSQNKKVAYLNNNINNLKANTTRTSGHQVEIKAALNNEQFFLYEIENYAKAQLIYHDPNENWILLKVPGLKSLSNPPLTRSEQLSVNDSLAVFVMGFPIESFYNQLPGVRVQHISSVLPTSVAIWRNYLDLTAPYEKGKREKLLKRKFLQVEQELQQLQSNNTAEKITKAKFKLLGQLAPDHAYRVSLERLNLMLAELEKLSIAELTMESIMRDYFSVFQLFRTIAIYSKRSPAQVERAILRYFENQTLEKEQVLFEAALSLYLKNVPQKYMPEGIIAKYQEAKKSVEEWTALAYFSSMFGSLEQYEKTKVIAGDNLMEYIEQDYLYQFWQDLQSAQSTVSKEKEEVLSKIFPIRNYYIDALKQTQTDYPLMSDANGSPRISLGYLQKMEDGNIQLKSRLINGFEGGIILNGKGEWLGMVKDGAFNASLKYFSDGELFDYGVIPAIKK